MAEVRNEVRNEVRKEYIEREAVEKEIVNAMDDIYAVKDNDFCSYGERKER